MRGWKPASRQARSTTLESAQVPVRQASIQSSSHRSARSIARRVASGWSLGSETHMWSSSRCSTSSPLVSVSPAKPPSSVMATSRSPRRTAGIESGGSISVELDLDGGAQLPEGGDRARDDRPGGGGEGGHAQAPAGVLGDLAELGLGGGDLGQDALGVADEHLAAGGQADAARLALDQLHADLLLEPRDLLRDGGLGVVERLGGGGEGASQRDLAQDAQQAEIVHNGTLSRRSSTII